MAQTPLGRELRRVHVDAHDDVAFRPGQFPRSLHKADVTRVQITHRRHQRDARAGAPPLERQTLHRRNCLHHTHGGMLLVQPRGCKSGTKVERLALRAVAPRRAARWTGPVRAFLPVRSPARRGLVGSQRDHSRVGQASRLPIAPGPSRLRNTSRDGQRTDGSRDGCPTTVGSQRDQTHRFAA